MAIDKCNFCGNKNVNDFGEKITLFVQSKDGIVSLRHLCDDCAREISTVLIMWSDHISRKLFRKTVENQPCLCSKCMYAGVQKEWLSGGKLICPNCKYAKEIVAIG